MNSDKFVIFTAMGDVCFSDSVKSEFDNKGIDPFENVKHILIDSDLNFCNLECPLTKNIKKQLRHYSKILNSNLCVFLKSDPRFAKILKDSNFNVVSLANNHILDYNEDGLFDTIDALNNVNISYIGAGKNIKEARRAYIFEKYNIKIAFLAYGYTYEATKNTAGCAPLWKSLMIKDLENIRGKVDHIIVSLHFGEEFKSMPSIFDKKLAHLLVDHGANLILGHHPHVLREIEYYKNSIIVHSLGNFLFDPSIPKVSGETLKKIKEGTIIKFNICKNKIIVDNMYPVHISDQGIPYLLTKSNKNFTGVGTTNHSGDVINNQTKQNNIYLKKFFDSLKLIYASLKIREFKNIYLIFKRYLNLL